MDRGALGRGPMNTLCRMVSLSILAVLALMSAGQGPTGGAGGGSSSTSVPASRRATNIAVITIKGEIDDTTLRSVVRRLGLAERAGAEAVVIELDTPGGDLWSVLGICSAIKACPIKNTVAWINKTAYSGGAIIALACRAIVVNESATMGDSLIINRMFGMINAMDEHDRQKLLSPLIAELVDSARSNGYDEMLVQGIASRGVELWLVENTETHQKLFVTRSEYELMFEKAPADSPSVLPSAPELSEAERKAAQEAVPAPDTGMSRLLQQKERRGGGPGGPGQARRAESRTDGEAATHPYVPAAPGMAALDEHGDVSRAQHLKSARPVITSADAGKWTLIEHVSTGSGPFIFKNDQLERYGLATDVVRNDQELQAYFGAKHLLRMNQSWSEGMVAVLTWFPVRGLLIVVFLIALFIEMTHPGLIAPGAIAAGALIALLAPPLLINMANWWEIAAILAGIVLIALEIFVIPGFGVAGVLGMLLLFGGLIGTFVPQGTLFPDSTRARNDLLYGVTTLVMSVATSGVAMYFISKHFKSLPFLNKLVLKDPVGEEIGPDLLASMAETLGPVRRGMIGTAITPLRPAGRVEMGPGGRIIDVVAELGFIPAGAKVKITSVSDFRIGVEKAEA